jgi:hypothetical protein
VFIDSTGKKIDPNNLTDEEKMIWGEVVNLANAKDDKGNFSNPELHRIYDRLDKDERTFIILNGVISKAAGGEFKITEFNGCDDFKTATITLDFNKMANLNTNRKADRVEGFKMFEGLLGKSKEKVALRMAELFGHEGRHATYALDHLELAVGDEKAYRALQEYHASPKNRGKYPVPPEIDIAGQVHNGYYKITETAAQITQKAVNAELRSSLSRRK